MSSDMPTNSEALITHRLWIRFKEGRLRIVNFARVCADTKTEMDRDSEGFIECAIPIDSWRIDTAPADARLLRGWTGERKKIYYWTLVGAPDILLTVERLLESRLLGWLYFRADGDFAPHSMFNINIIIYKARVALRYVWPDNSNATRVQV